MLMVLNNYQSTRENEKIVLQTRKKVADFVSDKDKK